MNDASVDIVEWQSCEALRSIRQSVFIDEQQIPPELEWDADDASAVHFLLRYQGVEVGTARLLPDGHIGRVAVLRPCRGLGLGEMLMREVMAQAIALGHERLRLSAQTYALGFYRRLGYRSEGEPYIEAGLPHQAMVWEGDDNLPPIEFSSPGRFAIHNPEEPARDRYRPNLVQQIGAERELIELNEELARDHACHLVQQARRTLVVHGADQAEWLFNQRDFISSCEQMIAAQPKSRIRVLLAEVKKSFPLGHSLVKLAHRFPSSCEIRRLHPEAPHEPQVFLLADDSGMLMLPRGHEKSGFVRYNTRDQVRRWTNTFDELWATSQSDPALRRFLI